MIIWIECFCSLPLFPFCEEPDFGHSWSNIRLLYCLPRALQKRLDFLREQRRKRDSRYNITVTRVVEMELFAFLPCSKCVLVRANAQSGSREKINPQTQTYPLSLLRVTKSQLLKTGTSRLEIYFLSMSLRGSFVTRISFLFSVNWDEPNQVFKVYKVPSESS